MSGLKHMFCSVEATECLLGRFLQFLKLNQLQHDWIHFCFSWAVWFKFSLGFLNTHTFQTYSAFQNAKLPAALYLRPKLQWVCIGNSSKGRRENRERVKKNTVPDVRKESTTKITACFPGPSPSSSVLELECLTSSALSSTRPAQF
jgi:hypothetical protein